jgi:hypothetical protein
MLTGEIPLITPWHFSLGGNMNFLKQAGAVVLGAIIVFSSGFASAAHLNVADDFTGVHFTTDANFEFGTNIIQNGPEDALFTGSWIAVAGGTPGGFGIIYFVAPGTNTLTDIYEVRWSWDGFQAAIQCHFESDVNGVLLSGRTIPPGFPTVETLNGSIDPLGLFRDPNTGDPVTLPSNLTMLVTFDYAPIAVESTTWSGVKTLLGGPSR